MQGRVLVARVQVDETSEIIDLASRFYLDRIIMVLNMVTLQSQIDERTKPRAVFLISNILRMIGPIISLLNEIHVAAWNYQNSPNCSRSSGKIDFDKALDSAGGDLSFLVTAQFSYFRCDALLMV